MGTWGLGDGDMGTWGLGDMIRSIGSHTNTFRVRHGDMGFRGHGAGHGDMGTCVLLDHIPTPLGSFRVRHGDMGFRGHAPVGLDICTHTHTHTHTHTDNICLFRVGIVGVIILRVVGLRSNSLVEHRALIG